MPASSSLDTYDLRILALLQEDAARPVAAIAEAVALSQNACWRRIKILEEQGFVRGRVALLDAARLGVGVTVFVSVRAAEHTEDWLQGFAAAVQRIPEVIEFHRMSGDVDYLLKLQVSDIADYDQVYKRLIRAARLTDVSSAFVMETLKATTAIPLPSPA